LIILIQPLSLLISKRRFFKKKQISIMDAIQIPDQSFDFSQLALAMPITMSSGTYMTKLQRCPQNSPLYIQTPTCSTRQGFTKTSANKIIADLMFEGGDSNKEFLEWIEALEVTSHTLLLEKSRDWFQDPLTLQDIESAFVPSLKFYKSGRSCSLRVQVKTSKQAKSIPAVKIYDENESMYGIDYITPEMNVMSIIEVVGVVFTSQSFNIEYELKQMMIMSTESIFDTCIMRTQQRQAIPSAYHAMDSRTHLSDASNDEESCFATANGVELPEESIIAMESHERATTEIFQDNSQPRNPLELSSEQLCPLLPPGQAGTENAEGDDLLPVDRDKTSLLDNELPTESSQENPREPLGSPSTNLLVPTTHHPSQAHDSEDGIAEEAEEQQEDSSFLLDSQALVLGDDPLDELVELDAEGMTLANKKCGERVDKREQDEEGPPVLKLKKAEDVYLELYNLAKSKAKRAKKEALAAYLEAEKIKHTFLVKRAKRSAEGEEYETSDISRGDPLMTMMSDDSDSDVGGMDDYSFP